MARKTEPTGIRQTVILLILLFCSSTVKAQQEESLEYRMEIGAGAGTCFYLGDANSTPFAHLSGMGSVLLRRILNPRMCVKGNLAFGHIKGTSEGRFIPENATSMTPEGGVSTRVDFSRNLIDVGAQFEMNFWGYGREGGYKENSPITPYATAGVGLTMAVGGAGTRAALCLPVGVGVKYKIKPRWNIGLEWTMRFTTCDELDVSKEEKKQLFQPYGIKSVGLKNKDCYSFTMLFVTYDISPKYRKCNN